MSKTASCRNGYCEPVSPTRGFMRIPSISGMSPSVTTACPTGCWQMQPMVDEKVFGMAAREAGLPVKLRFCFRARRPDALPATSGITRSTFQSRTLWGANVGSCQMDASAPEL